jgi:tetratricopeptide (TPR) repeat protein
MSQTVTCPHCHTLLRSSRPIPVGANLRCPDCKGPFNAPDLLPEIPPVPSVARSNLFGAPFVIAVTVSLLLGASIITAALLVIQSRPAETAAPPANDDRLLAQRKQLDEERAKLDERKRLLECKELVAKGKAALDRGSLAVAEKLFTQALELVPGDADAVNGLVEVKARLAAAAHGKDLDAKQLAEVNRLLTEGKKALADKQFATAVRLLESARVLAPANSEVLEALGRARTALDADVAEKKKLADYRLHMLAGKKALQDERYADAVREFLAALALMPDDLEAQQGQKQAEARIAALADKDKRQAAFADLAERGRKALDAKRFKAAIRELEAALRILPDDRDAQRDLREAKDALKRVKSENPRLLARADDQVKLGRLEQARSLCEDAVKNWAEDEDAEKALKNVNRLIEAARTAREGYAAYVQQGALAMATRRWADAIAAYTEAVRLVPTDLESIRQLRLARKALEAEVKARLEYARQVKLGNAALDRRLYNDAVKAFTAALVILPDDVIATAGLSKARLGKGLADGQKALLLRRKNDAIAAFQMALDEDPDNVVAAAGLRQANRMR